MSGAKPSSTRPWPPSRSPPQGARGAGWRCWHRRPPRRLFVALLAWGLLTKPPDDRVDQALARGESSPPPELSLPVLERGRLGPRLSRSLARALADRRIDVQELRGTPVVLNYWASWCVPCREEAPLLERGWRAQRDRGVLFLGVNMQDITADARRFMRQFDVSYLNVRDPTDRTARRWGGTGIPETFFMSAGGQVVGHVIGVVFAEQMHQGLLAARTGRAFGLQQGRSSANGPLRGRLKPSEKPARTALWRWTRWASGFE